MCKFESKTITLWTCNKWIYAGPEILPCTSKKISWTYAATCNAPITLVTYVFPADIHSTKLCNWKYEYERYGTPCNETNTVKCLAKMEDLWIYINIQVAKECRCIWKFSLVLPSHSGVFHASLRNPCNQKFIK